MLRTGVLCCGASPQGKTPSNRTVVGSLAFRKRHAGGPEGETLPGGDRADVKICDLLLEQSMKVEPCPQPNKGAAQTDRGPIHENKFSRRADTAKLPELGMDFIRLLKPVHGCRDTIVHEPSPVVQQGRKNESRPHVHDPHQLWCNCLETPTPIRRCRERIISVLQCAIEINYASYEGRRKRTNTTKVEKVGAAALAHGVISQMWIPMDGAVSRKRAPPCPEQRGAHAVPHG